MSSELRALSEGRIDEAGSVRDIASDLGNRLERLADRTEELGLRGVAEEVSDFARRRPAAFLFGSLAAGVVFGRLARAAKTGTPSSQGATLGSDVAAVALPTPTASAGSGAGPGVTLGAVPAAASGAPVGPAGVGEDDASLVPEQEIAR
jgi:hypothetical protein